MWTTYILGWNRYLYLLSIPSMTTETSHTLYT